MRFVVFGFAKFAAALSEVPKAGRGPVSRESITATFPSRRSSIPTPIPGITPTQSKSRMRENFTYGSVRGAAGNGSPYRDSPTLVWVRSGAAWPRIHESNPNQIRSALFNNELRTLYALRESEDRIAVTKPHVAKPSKHGGVTMSAPSIA